MTDREHAIIMSAVSIRGILAGRKSQTRRLVGRALPYGVGARLWVKEAWREDVEARWEGNRKRIYLYRADPGADEAAKDDEACGIPSKWGSPMFMPRRASRITLEVTSIREERLHELTEEDAIAEGIERHETLHDVHWLHGGRRFASAQTAYSCAWNDLHGKRAPWSSNPVVRVITFRRVEGACAG